MYQACTCTGRVDAPVNWMGETHVTSRPVDRGVDGAVDVESLSMVFMLLLLMLWFSDAVVLILLLLLLI
jgi:hypothetical protein